MEVLTERKWSGNGAQLENKWSAKYYLPHKYTYVLEPRSINKSYRSIKIERLMV